MSKPNRRSIVMVLATIVTILLPFPNVQAGDNINKTQSDVEVLFQKVAGLQVLNETEHFAAFPEKDEVAPFSTVLQHNELTFIISFVDTALTSDGTIIPWLRIKYRSAESKNKNDWREIADAYVDGTVDEGIEKSHAPRLASFITNMKSKQIVVDPKKLRLDDPVKKAEIVREWQRHYDMVKVLIYDFMRRRSMPSKKAPIPSVATN